MTVSSPQDANEFRLAGDYKLPYDNEEAQRLDFQHELFRLTFKGRLYFAPIGQPSSVLDIGSGTSSWPIEIARKFPESQVQGLDLALPDALTSTPPSNYKFVQANFERPWPVSGSFDYIHQRFLIIAMKNHKFVIEQAFRNLKPGGWYEIAELEVPFRPMFGLAGEWSQKEYEATKALGADMMAATKWEEWTKEVGFVNVKHEEFEWRVGKAEGMTGHDADVAEMAFKNIRRAVDGVSLMNFVDGLGWSKEDALEYNERVRQDMDANQGKNVLNIHVIWAQKPEK